MAELGALANFAGVISAGLQLSMVLYEFASTIGSAGKEIKSVAREVSLLCRVLKQVQSMLSKVKAFRVSTNAIQLTQDILDRCQEIFGELDDILKSLQRDSKSLDFLTRLKWVYKKSGVLVKQQSLTSCTYALHIMISTMDFAQRIATASVPEVEHGAQDDEDRAMTSSLLLAQQSINEELSELENAFGAELATNEDPRPPELQEVRPFESATARDPSIRRQRNRSYRFADNPPSDQILVNNSTIGQRTSILLNSHIYSQDVIALSSRAAIASVADKRRSIELSNALLQTWTDQMDPLAEEIGEDATSSDNTGVSSKGLTTPLASITSSSASAQTPSEKLKSDLVVMTPIVPPLTVLTFEETTELVRKKFEEARQNAMLDLTRDEEGGGEALSMNLTLDLTNSNIARLPDTVVDLVKNETERISLQQNQIWHLPLHFAQCPKLRYLNLRRNLFREIPRCVYLLPLLEILDLGYNQVRTISPRIKKLTHLRVLSIMRNRLTDLPTELCELELLQILKIAKNPVNTHLKRFIEATEAELASLTLSENEEAALLTTKIIKYLKESQAVTTSLQYSAAHREDELSCRPFLQMAMRKRNIGGEPLHYALFITYDSENRFEMPGERHVPIYEDPMVVYKELSAKGRNVMFVIRKMYPRTYDVDRFLPVDILD